MADATLNEIRQRLTRVESRICRMAEAQGIKVGDPTKDLSVVRELGDAIVVSTPVLDVTISEVIHFLHKEGKAGKIAYVQFGGIHVATIVGGPHGTTTAD